MWAFFNRAANADTSDFSIAEAALMAFNSATSGSRVIGAMYNWGHKEFSEKILNIKNARNLEIEIVAGHREDDGSGPVPSQAIKTFFSKLDGGGVWKANPGSDWNHTKFFMFHDFDFDSMRQKLANAPPSMNLVEFGIRRAFPADWKHALFLGSWNATTAGSKKHQHAVLVPISQLMVEELEQYYQAMLFGYQGNDLLKTAGFWEKVKLSIALASFPRDQYSSGKVWVFPLQFSGLKPVLRYQARPTEDANVKLYFFPRKKGKKASRDTIANALENVEYYVNPNGSGPCEIDIVTARWRGSRLQVAKHLSRIYENSGRAARIRVICRSPTDINSQDGKPELAPKVEAELRKCATRYYQKAGVNIHSKYMVLRCRYRQADGTYRLQKLVWAGTLNMSGKSISSAWELLTKLKPETGLHASFLENVEYLISHGTEAPRLPA